MGHVMRVGVYIDGFNLYYGGRSFCGRSKPGWRWLDLRSLSQRLINYRHDWTTEGATLKRVVYCTAFINGATNESGRLDQDRYVRALNQHGSVDHLEPGKYSEVTKRALLATGMRKGKPALASSQWPIMIKDADMNDVPDAHFMVKYKHVEEKGSDVNLASHLLVDVFDDAIDAAIVISNDSDQRLPLQTARQRVPIGTVNPHNRPMAGDLTGSAEEGAGRHWWYQLTVDDFMQCQLPNPAGGIDCPEGW